MANVFYTFATIGTRRYGWAHAAGAAHVAISVNRLAPVIICNVMEYPERVGTAPTWVAHPRLPFCANCRALMDDFDGRGARDLVRALEELEGEKQP